MTLRQILNLNAPIRRNMKTIHCLLMSSWASGCWTSTHPFCHFDVCVACSVWIQLTYSTVYICHFSVNNTSTWQLHNTFQTRSALIESIDPSQIYIIAQFYSLSVCKGKHALLLLLLHLCYGHEWFHKLRDISKRCAFYLTDIKW